MHIEKVNVKEEVQKKTNNNSKAEINVIKVTGCFMCMRQLDMKVNTVYSFQFNDVYMI